MRLASDILREAAQTFDERNAVYGDNYLLVGQIMAAHFPNGLTVNTVDDWNRLHIFILGVVKDTRYANNWKGGHQDSLRDATVYRSMLEMIDEEIGNRPKASDRKEETKEESQEQPQTRMFPPTPKPPPLSREAMGNGGIREAIAQAREGEASSRPITVPHPPRRSS